ncbi:hypothetical protein F503_02534 [Ophiostoma piceae UAMH 11346]|uniref:Uncharacterized protein n=1 Tax=Ophiostoma piceae (strain UAMH 11346) TaxID=1262450 RepID=S3C3P4_OPHP1|nr:hypothetical protein F503_02534 [Ophiostoma piceae UAMH 11346]
MNRALFLLFAVPCLGIVASAASTTSAQRAWAKIDYEGRVSTVTPTVDGATIVSEPPSSLTQISEYILSVNGHQKTTTAIGAFMVCDSANYASLTNAAASGPFCQPQTGSQLTPNTTYYITWDPAYFAAIGLQIVDAATISFYLAYNRSSLSAGGKRLMRMPGPSVVVTSAPATVQHHLVAVAAIVTPVVISALVLGTMAFCVWSYQHHGHLPWIGKIVSKRTSSFSAKGYNVRHYQNYGQETGSFGITGGRVFSSPTTTSGNAFRDELKRQEQERV